MKIVNTAKLWGLLFIPLLLTPPPIYAQSSAEEDETIEEVVVTGSRILRSELSAPTPLQIMSAEDIEVGAETNIGEFLNQLPVAGEPALTRTGTGFSTAASGQTSIDLRDLVSTRTLTLVNGRRHVAGVPGSSAVDFNAIPSALVERVEVITGGAAAVYGSDAIAGVINFIYKRDFEGVDFRMKYGATAEHGDDQDTDISMLVGSNFEDGKGNAVFFLGYSDQGAVYSRDRERTRLDAVANRSDPLGPRNLPTCSSGPPQGRFDVDGARGGTSANWTYDADGNLQDSFDASDPGADDCENGFNRSAYRTIAIPTERLLMGGNTHWNLSDSTRMFFEGTWVSTRTFSRLEPFFLNVEDAFPSDDINVDAHGMPLEYEDSSGNMINNPFIPAEVLAAANASVTARAAANAADPDDALHSGYIGVVRRLVEFGPRTADSERRTTRIVFGLDGEFNDWRWDLSLNYGQTTQEQISGGRLDLNALRNALLAEEDPTTADDPNDPDDTDYRCVNPVARGQGCVPIDLFGGIGSIGPVLTSRGLRDPRPYITADTNIIAKIEQRILQGNITGNIMELPAGPVGVAFGFEMRKEKSNDDRDSLSARGLGSGNAIPSVRGQFDVNELYAEINVPLLGDGSVTTLNFGAAGRMSDYSSIGNVSSFEARLEAVPFPTFLPSLRLRFGHAQPVRSPNIDELFAAAGETFAQVNDPCVGVGAAGTDEDNNVNPVVGDNCRSIAAVARRIATPIPDPADSNAKANTFQVTQAELQGTSGLVGEGNMNLEKETGITTTLGFTYGFSWGDSVDGSIAMDWFDIEVDDAIQAISQNNTLDLCYKSVGLSDPLCGNIERFVTTGALKQVDTQVINSALLTTKGVDILVSLNMDAETLIGMPGYLDAGLNWTLLNQYSLVPLPGQPVDEDVGEIGNAEHRWNANISWIPNDAWAFRMQVRYIGESRLDDNSHNETACAGYASGCLVDPVIYTDLRLSHNIMDRFGPGSVTEIFFGLENALDTEPPILGAGLSGAGSDTGTETNADVYDAIGRSWYLGFKVNL